MHQSIEITPQPHPRHRGHNGEFKHYGYRMVPLDECSLARARKLFASARMLGFSLKLPAV